MDAISNNSLQNNSTQTLEQATSVNTPAQEPTFSIVLLHGLMANENELEPIASKILDKFGRTAFVIQPTCRRGTKSITSSIKNQAGKILKQIHTELDACNKQSKSLPIFIIGYSQGGVLACLLGKHYRDDLNIRGIVTINSPLGGAPLLERSRSDVQRFMADAQEGLQRITSRTLSSIQKEMKLGAFALTIVSQRWIPIPCVGGLKGIFPNSSSVQDVYGFLRDGDAHDIPCLLIAGYENDFKNLFSNISFKDSGAVEAMKALNNAYAEFVTGKSSGKHDTLIPLGSQLGRGSSFDDLTSLTDTNNPIVMPMPNQPNVEGRIYKNIAHAGNLIAIDADLFINSNTTETVLRAGQISNDLMLHIEKWVQALQKDLEVGF
ncbi:hypothetical protein [Cardinium endosymbiont of Tipula unca]|uniref:esterase/lipase family protein n=1 Tax=Cardinium endosymbiont of Tipula unca TaxID=3066216 RepID=UPI0030D41144